MPRSARATRTTSVNGAPLGSRSSTSQSGRSSEGTREAQQWIGIDALLAT